MYVCICNAVRESDLERAVLAGQNFEQFSAATGCAGTCGTCKEDAQELYAHAQRTLRSSKNRIFNVPVFAL